MAGYALKIDHDACFGCPACEVARKQENSSDHGIKWIDMMEIGSKIMNGKLDFRYEVNACLHSACEGTPCIEPCH